MSLRSSAEDKNHRVSSGGALQSFPRKRESRFVAV